MAGKKGAGKKSGNVGGAKPPKGADVVAVADADGIVIRTYSESEHGADFLALAKEFAGKVEGRQVVAAE